MCNPCAEKHECSTKTKITFTSILYHKNEKKSVPFCLTHKAFARMVCIQCGTQFICRYCEHREHKYHSMKQQADPAAERFREHFLRLLNKKSNKNANKPNNRIQKKQAERQQCRKKLEDELKKRKSKMMEEFSKKVRTRT